MQVATIETPQLGDRSYLVHDGEVALVIDPQRDIDRIQTVARAAQVRITGVAETHIHNDYLTGGIELARTHDAAYLLSSAEEVTFDHHPVADGDEFTVGSLTVRVIATPGHTYHHLSYLVSDNGPPGDGQRGDGQQAVFSGGSLLYGSVGRTDLLTPQDTEPLTRAQYASVRALAEQAGDHAVLYPTHGFGSFCSAGPATGAERSTIGEQKRDNHALTDPDEEHFVAALLAGLGDYPAYYLQMSQLNRKGPDPAELSVPVPLDAAALRSRLDGGQWVVDLRDRAAFAAGHLRSAVSFEYADGTNFTTFLGWTLPWGDPITLLGTCADIKAAIRDLSRIGIDAPWVVPGDRPEQFLTGYPVQSYRRAGWAELRTELHSPHPRVVLDVRRDEEYTVDHIDGALHIPLHQLRNRFGELPKTAPEATLWVYCGSGYRSGIAASLLQRAGHNVVHIDADWSAAATTGLPIVPN